MSFTNEGISRRTFSGLAIGAIAAGFAGCSNGAKPHSDADIAALEKAIGQKVSTPSSGAGYDGARHIWNELFDRKPAIIAPCRNAKDVSRCIAFAREHGLALSVRSGAHHPAGLAMNDGGMVIDLSQMKAIKIERGTARVTVEPGVLVGELDLATEPEKLVVPTAAFPTVGLGGMTLGGGEGWFAEFGLACDNLLSAELVLADGRIVRVDKASEPDLFWAIRGGGGNFGVVTKFEYQAHPLKDVMLGMMGYPLEQARTVGLKLCQHSLTAAPDFAGKILFVRNPAPAMLIASKTARSMPEAQAEFAKLRAFGPSMPDMVRPIGLAELQMMGAANAGTGNRYFAENHYLTDVTPEILDIAVKTLGKAPNADASLVIHTQSSGIRNVPPGATAYPHRGARFSFHAQARWADKKDDDRNIGWVKEWWKTVLPLATGGVYGNYFSETGADVAERSYGSNYARLAKTKQRFDPDNVFRSTINVKPV